MNTKTNINYFYTSGTSIKAFQTFPNPPLKPIRKKTFLKYLKQIKHIYRKSSIKFSYQILRKVNTQVLLEKLLTPKFHPGHGNAPFLL